MLAPLFASILPFFLWPIEYFLPLPYLVEELAKGLLVYVILRYPLGKQSPYLLALISGFLFSFSETILYVFNLIEFGNYERALQRLLSTLILHAGTMLIMVYFGKRKITYLPLGIFTGGIIHYLWNLLV